MRRFRSTLAAIAAVGFTTVAASAVLADTTLLNVSYDPTRELYKAVNEAFAKDWQAKTGEKVTTLKDASRRLIYTAVGCDDTDRPWVLGLSLCILTQRP